MGEPLRAAVSAPGKVLLSGGYLVTDRSYRGLVFGLDARIHVIVESDERPSQAHVEGHSFEVVVKSPQFNNTEWQYTCEPRGKDRGCRVTQR
jgi:phosphomevalonate kinase